MRENHYRAWDKEKQHMEYDFDGTPKFDGEREYRLVYIKGKLQFCHMENWLYDPQYYVIMQFTGQKDKNGKDLDWWEGDLFKMHGHSNPWAIVKEQGCFWFQCPITKERSLCYRVAEYFNQPIKIGNIHESPELMENKK